jgi:esterase/lipase
MEIKSLVIKSLNTIIYKSRNVNQVLIAIHGIGGSKNSDTIYNIAKVLTLKNCDVIAFDLPCHGDNNNEDCLNLSSCIKSIKDIDNFVKENYKCLPISYFATSFGGYLLLNFLSNNKYVYKKIILRSPAIYMEDVVKNMFLESSKSLDTYEILDIGFNQPLFIDTKFYNDLILNNLTSKYINTNFINVIQGKKDEVVDYHANEEFYKSKCKSKFKIFYFPESNHTYDNLGDLDKIIVIVKDLILGEQLGE